MNRLYSLVLPSLLLLANGAAVAGAASFELPALNSPATTEHHVGKVIWADLVTPNLEAAEKFYGGLFGWTFQPIRAGDTDYVVAQLAGRPVAGIVEKPTGATQRQSAWLTFIAVRDVDAAKRNAVAHRAKVLADSAMYASRGRQAVLADPEGAVFALLASSSGDPPDELPDPGEWIWSSLHVKDPGAAAAFYQNVFGYDVFDNSEAGREHLILSSDDYARASANPLPASAGKRHAHWLNFLRVTDAKDAAARATTLGGRVLVEAHVDRQGSTVAVVADPAGAPIGLLQWDTNDAPAEAK
jgi:uncharacterized protein